MIENLADVSLTIEDTDEDEEDKEDEEEEEDAQNEGNEGGPGWSAMASMCKPSTSLGRGEEEWGKEDHWLILGAFQSLFLSRSIFFGF